MEIAKIDMTAAEMVAKVEAQIEVTQKSVDVANQVDRIELSSWASKSVGKDSTEEDLVLMYSYVQDFIDRNAASRKALGLVKKDLMLGSRTAKSLLSDIKLLVQARKAKDVLKVLEETHADLSVEMSREQRLGQKVLKAQGKLKEIGL